MGKWVCFDRKMGVFDGKWVFLRVINIEKVIFRYKNGVLQGKNGV
jgi:hypothetical protein